MQDLTFFRGSEAWVGEFLKMLPQHKSILRNYVWNAAQVTDANAGHHIPMGLILLAQMGPERGVWLSDGAIFNNLFTLVLGSTGSRKTACIKIGRKVGRAAGLCTLETPLPGSREGFMDGLDPEVNRDNSPRQALLYNEFADFLGITAPGGKGRPTGHATTLRSALMNVYDGDALTRKLAGAGGQDRQTGLDRANFRGAEHPVVSLIGAANYYVLSKNTSIEDWMDGFMGRFLLIDGEMERYNFRQRPMPAEMDDVIRAIEMRAAMEHARYQAQGAAFPAPCMEAPHMDFTPEVQARVEPWAKAMRDRMQSEPNMLVAAALSRIESLCYRIALLLSYDYGEAGGFYGDSVVPVMPQPGWRITSDVIEPAIFLAERHLEAYMHASANVVLNDEERPIRDVEQIIRKGDNNAVTYTEGEISHHTSRNDRTVSDALRTLVARGVVRKVQREGSPVLRYQLVNGIAERILYMPNVMRAVSNGPALFPDAPPAIMPSLPSTNLF